MKCTEINGLSVHTAASRINFLGIQHCADCNKALLPVHYGEIIPNTAGIYGRNELGILQLISASEENLREFEDSLVGVYQLAR